MMRAKAEKQLEKASTFEKIIYGLGDIGANFGWTFMSLFITMYYTDSVGLSTAFAGTMMLVTRIFDGISDILFASIMEKTHLKAGKVRPWFLIAAPLLGLGIFLCFHVPAGLSMQGKQLFSFITYFFMAVIAHTIYSISYTGFLPLMSLDPDDRNIISALSRIFTMAGILVMNVVTPILLGLWGGERTSGAWANLSTIYAVICAVLVAMMGIFIREKHDDREEKFAAAGKPQLKELLSTVVHVPYFWMLAVMFMMFYLTSGLTGVSTYFYRDVLGNLDLMGVMSFLGVVPTLVRMPLIPKLFSRFGKRKVCMLSLLLTILSDVTAIFISIADLVDYISQRKHMRAEGFVSMASSVGQKIGTGIGTAIVGWGLSWCGYNAALTTQTQGTRLGITLIFLGIPVLCNIVSLLVVRGWKIEAREPVTVKEGADHA